MKSICIIPARSEVLELKNKNIINFSNKPIIYWSILAAKKSKCFKKIFVSTDSQKIAKLSKNLEKLKSSKDQKKIDSKTPLIEVIQHASKEIEISYDAVCCILPASPLIMYQDIQANKNFFQKM